MSRLQTRFASLRELKRKALIPFITAGDPDPAVTLAVMHALVAAGADAVELGVPFSDPMADGPIVQRANERALAKRMSLARVLDLVAQFRGDDATTPVVLMGYLNPLEAAGYEAFAVAAAKAGVDGLITVDLPPEEAEQFVAVMRGNDIDTIFLLSPTSSEDRIRRICAAASGFIYYVSLKGVTGAATLDVAAVAAKVSQIKSQTSLPVGVGFGIRDAASAAQISKFSDAVVVGSVLVQAIEELAGRPDQIPQRISSILASMRRAMDTAA